MTGWACTSTTRAPTPPPRTTHEHTPQPPHRADLHRRCTRQRPQILSLPAVFDRLERGVATDFGALQAHQLQSWESFLIQLGALAAVANGGTAPVGEDAWRGALRALTGGDDGPWCLIVDDITKPAFMQPPAAGKDFREPKKAMAAPDLFDMLITSKNLDVKCARAIRARPEHWVFSLVNVQTTDGYPGRGNYGIARMTSGAGSRPSVGSAPP
nr:hypothetical protein [Deltaproteobacteria bacterium]